MPNVDDHGLEVLKKAARNIGPTPKTDYALQMVIVGDESGGTTPFTPNILNVPAPDANTEIAIDLPEDCKAFVLKSRKGSRMRLSYVEGGTETSWLTIPHGGYYSEEKRLSGQNVYVQTDRDDNIIEVVAYT